MSRKANPTAVGGFVLGALAIAVVAIATLGDVRWFSERDRWSIFFEGSVQGLGVGSAVRFQGVKVGEVVDVRAIARLDPDRVNIITETVIEIDHRRFDQRGILDDVPEFQQLSDHEQNMWLIDHGLRAQLEMESLVTGQLTVALVVRPDTQVRLLEEDSHHDQLPAIPTALEQMGEKFEGLLENLAALPLQDVAANLNATLASLDRLLNDPAIASALVELNRTLVSTRTTMDEAGQLARNLDAKVDPLAGATLAALERADSALATFDQGSPLTQQVAVTLMELTDAAEALRLLATTLERQPDALLFGRTEP